MHQHSISVASPGGSGLHVAPFQHSASSPVELLDELLPSLENEPDSKDEDSPPELEDSTSPSSSSIGSGACSFATFGGSEKHPPTRSAHAMLDQIPADVTSIGSTGLLAYVAWHAVKFLATVSRFLERVEDHLEATKDHRKAEASAWGRVADHLQTEEAHQARVESLLVRVPNPAPPAGTARNEPLRFRPPPAPKLG